MRKTSTKAKKVRPQLVVLGSTTTGLQAASWLELPADKHPFHGINKALRNLRQRDEYVEDLHLIAHGNSDGIELAGKWINEAILFRYSAVIAQWKVKTIVLWCCNIGRNKDFVKALENIAGAEVFASTEVINQLQITTKNKKGKSRNLDTLLKQDVISEWRGELSAAQRGGDIDGKAQGDRSGW